MGINDPRLASVKKEVKSLKEQVSAISGSEGATWNTIEGKPAVIAAGATAAAARSAIGAGTSNLTIGTTASTAMAGNTTIPAAATWANLSGKPAVIAAGADQAAARTAIGAGTSNLAIGTSASTAAAGNHNHNGVYATAADLAALVARVEALESAE